MKRRSLVLPVFLILTGVFFLIGNIWHGLDVFPVIATYWPFLLIGWGVIRLIEILLAAARSNPLPVRGLSGGEVLLVIFICLVGSSLWVAQRHGQLWRAGPFGVRSLEMFGEAYDYPVAVQKPADAVRRVVLENLRGNVRVTGSTLGEIKITGRKTIRAFSRSDADKGNQNTPVEIVTEGDRIVVRTNQERISRNRTISTDLDITVPQGAAVEGRGRYGDFDIAGVRGDVDLSSENAGIRLNKIGGNVRIDLRRSDIVRAIDIEGNVDLQGRGSDLELENISGQVSINGSYSGTLEFQNLAKPLHFESRHTDLRVEALPGRIVMDLGDFTAKKLIGPIRLVTRSRDIKIEDFTHSLELETERGDIELRPLQMPLAKIEARSRAGNINLALPESAKFDLKASTERGEVRNDFGPAIQIEIDGRAASLKGIVGQGPAIRVTTQRGTVAVRKG